MITVRVKTDKNAKEIFKKIAQNIEDELILATDRALKKAERVSKSEYLRGPRPQKLGVKTGTLISSVRAGSAQLRNGKIAGEFGVLRKVPYAAIHEFGGKTKPHEIKPKPPRKALRFMFKGVESFFKKVNHPGSNIPARPYINPAIQKVIPDWLKSIGAIFKKYK